VRAVWITAGNPVAMLPDSHKVAEALRTRELVVVVDPFMTDTARLAHLVLPTTTLIEDDDVVGAYGHHYLGTVRPLVPPPGEAKTDLEIVQALAARVGLGEVMAGSARAWKEKIVAPRLGPYGVTVDALDAGAVRNPIAPRVLFEGRRFPTPSGKVNLMTAAPSAEALAGPDPGYPLWLMSLSTPDAQSSQWTRKLDGPATCTVHPDAAAGLPDGALATLETRHGRMHVKLVHDAAQRRDVAIVPKGGHLGAGRAANALIAARTSDIGEGASLYDERARIVRPA
jgi:anaerobic selenocysteine-containing dehydrogenase